MMDSNQTTEQKALKPKQITACDNCRKSHVSCGPGRRQLTKCRDNHRQNDLALDYGESPSPTMLSSEPQEEPTFSMERDFLVKSFSNILSSSTITSFSSDKVESNSLQGGLSTNAAAYFDSLLSYLSNYFPESFAIDEASDPYDTRLDVKGDQQRYLKHALSMGWCTERDIEEINLFAAGFKEKRSQVVKFISPDQATQMRTEFLNHLQNCIHSSNETDTPCIIWLQFGIVYHANQAYRDFTGFSEPLPMHYDRFLLLEAFRYPQTFDSKIVRERIMHCHEKFNMFPVELKIWNNEQNLPLSYRKNPVSEQEEGYIDCVMSVTVKRDTFNMPVIFYGSFIPSIEVLHKMHSNP
ncbi:hypothetical protein PROFUN_13270 [Planoprotostelium fungivorum]|uniref:Uncharacterized protein n=1 Tax=Planoprotostelium fungivorum TaxID=1890364 RepID=A0A2P6N4T4_9EUKA|nr:hypothetical protein PROFUN_13270 [Planoprotostelium fungivorum]